MRRALLLVMLVAAPAAVAEEPYSRGTPVAFWVQPLGALYGGASDGVVYVPLGFSVGLGDALSFQLEAAPIFKPSDGVRSALGAIGSLGLAWHLATRPGQSGPFVHFKATGGYLKHEEPAPRPGRDDPTAGSQIEVGGGIDLGWQFRFKALLVAPVLGLGVVYRMTAETSAVLQPAYTAAHGPVERGDQLEFGFNVNLLRLGVIF